MKHICTILLLACSLHIHAQNIRTTTVTELFNRASNSDTTYIINFWATWCAPCVEELPAFEKLSAEYKKNTLKIILVSLDYASQIESALKPFIKKQQLKSEVLLLREQDEQAFINKVDSSWSGSLPATLFIRNNRKAFFEKAFSYTELVNRYKNFIQ